MKSHCYLEPIVGILRAGPKTVNFGDPFEFSCTVIMDKNVAILKGACGKFTKASYVAIVKVLKDNNIKQVHWEKLNNKERKVEGRLEKTDD